MKKPGRNDPCSCGSGKKFKKCCELKLFAGRFKAEKIDEASSFQTASRITSFFKSHLPASVQPSNSQLDEKEPQA